MYPWVRLNRIIRDIPNMNILGGNKCVHLRDVLHKKMKKEKLECQCIRCREVKNQESDITKAELFIREYNAINGKEYFISYESSDTKILYGFLRLRINHSNTDIIYEELNDCSFVRELHVYGEIVKHGTKSNKIQHKGFGKKLLQKAEEITFNNNINKVAIISGVGVREYYKNNGYNLIKTYMIKDLRYKSVVLIQSCFRGYKERVIINKHENNLYKKELHELIIFTICIFVYYIIMIYLFCFNKFY